jgi:phosphoglycerate dehydrogenase-like enzyme
MARPTAELGATFLLAEARDVFGYSAKMRKRSNGVYREVHESGGGTESLMGREVGLIGLGRIGHALVELMRGFDIRWRVFDPYARQQGMAPGGCRFEELEDVLRGSSLLVLAAAATAETANLLSAERLAMLPDGAAVINIARGSLVDLEALTREVLAGRLRCALDVTDPEEPLPVTHPLRRHAGAVLTPHIGGGGTAVRRRMAAVALDSLERHFAGEAPLYRVTPEMLERMT